MNMITIGVDFHKRTSSYHVLDEAGRLVRRHKMENNPDDIKDFITSIPGKKKLAMEACRSWNLYYDSVKDLVEEFHLGHPTKMKAITSSETKNDRADAHNIALLAYTGFLPEAHVSSVDIRHLRSLVRFRGHLVKQRRAMRNQIHSLIDRNVWPCQKPTSFKNPLCARGRGWLKELALPDRERFILEQGLLSLDRLKEQILGMEKYIREQEYDMPGIEYLRTVPGFLKSTVNTYCVLVETSDIHRFKRAKSYAHYAGLVPQNFSTGDKHITGKLIKGANLHLRTAIIESTLAAIRKDRGLRTYYMKKKETSGSGDAIVATARKLSYAIYHVLKERRAYIFEDMKTPAAACHSSSVIHVKKA